jgi:ferredoxin-NADP reductase
VTSERPLALRVADIRPETPRAALLRIDLEGEAFRYKAGQLVNLGLADDPVRKPYSIACSPEYAAATGRVELLVGLDARGRIGGHLAGLEPGALVEVDGPAGEFVLPPRISEHQLVFIAGGIGVAPLRAMIGSALAMEQRPEIALVYSARTDDDFAFDVEFRRMARAGVLRLHQTVTRAAGSAWNGRRGRIDGELLACVVGHAASTSCFVCGPDGLVAAVPPMLRELGVPPARIHFERY